jgi:hypothetical protein
MSKNKTTQKKDRVQTLNTGVALAAKSSSVSFPPVIIQKYKASKRPAL